MLNTNLVQLNYQEIFLELRKEEKKTRYYEVFVILSRIFEPIESGFQRKYKKIIK